MALVPFDNKFDCITYFELISNNDGKLPGSPFLNFLCDALRISVIRCCDQYMYYCARTLRFILCILMQKLLFTESASVALAAIGCAPTTALTLYFYFVPNSPGFVRRRLQVQEILAHHSLSSWKRHSARHWPQRTRVCSGACCYPTAHLGFACFVVIRLFTSSNRLRFMRFEVRTLPALRATAARHRRMPPRRRKQQRFTPRSNSTDRPPPRCCDVPNVSVLPFPLDLRSASRREIEKADEIQAPLRLFDYRQARAAVHIERKTSKAEPVANLDGAVSGDVVAIQVCWLV